MTEIFLTDELSDTDKLEELDSIREKIISAGADINPIESSKNLTTSFMEVMSHASALWVILFFTRLSSTQFFCN